ncbi:helix-turn-helix transcriptional regulator [Burkholderia dolosa]|uniref:helix-turn-helix transcriptional regulator n=1 Tax=Burkholderia dolosa TaxID=152500 RepID=UPI0015910A08|nr:helix-turn-helix transcriptional regulator [Burkholderia dolosa]MBY4754544.1 helix-turn-helix transcriptional regulator [Burkholderia dolosa]
MLLDVNPLHRDTDRAGVSFKALGELIETVGTPHFVPRLTQLLNDVVPLDVAHVERSRVDGTMPTGYRCEWIGSSGIGTATLEISDVMTLYYERFFDRDPLFAGLRGKTGTMLVVRDIAAIPPGEFRQRLFDDVRIAHECVLARGTRYAQHSIALERGRDRPPFTLAEMNRFRSVSDVLFPLLELHASTTAARRVAHPAPDVHPLAQFDARIAADGVKLSKREYETCKHLISGKTVPETAAILGVRVASAESYVKRAFMKLGVRTKRELVAWGSAGTALPGTAGRRDDGSLRAIAG